MQRTPEYPINKLFINRWSPRSMTADDILDKELFTIFEAARWAPSSKNYQPWRFIYAKRGTKQFDVMFPIMNEANQVWAKNASALVVVVSKMTFDNEQINKNHSFDAGASSENMALQAADLGYMTHAMAGIDHEKAMGLLGIPKDYSVDCMIAIGKIGKKENLPFALQEREVPSQRKLMNDILMEGKFRI